MTERASDLLSELADRLSDKASESGLVAAESVRAIEPELLRSHKDGSVDELVKTSVAFLEILFRSLRPDSKVPWNEYYTVAREASRRYAEKGVPLESLMEGLAVFRRSVIARVTDEIGASDYADEVLLLAQRRLGSGRRPAEAGQDDRDAAGRGGGVLRVRPWSCQGGRGVVRTGGVAGGPNRRRVERDPGRAAHQGRAARSDDSGDQAAQDL